MTRSRHPLYPWIIVLLLFLLHATNWADKAIVGLAAIPIMRDLGLSHTQFGFLGSSFFFLFALSGIMVGFLANHVKAKWVLGGMAFSWALLQLPMTGSVSFLGMLGCRIALGAAEGPGLPMAQHAAYKWFSDERRTFPSSLITNGGAVGASVVAPVLTFVIVRYSWHAAFGVLAAAGFIWLAAWLILGAEGNEESGQGSKVAATIIEPTTSYWRLLTCGTAVGAMIAGFVAYWGLTLSIVWVPAYLAKGPGYGLAEVGWLVALPGITQIALSPAIAWLSQAMRIRGFSSRLTRGIFTGGCLLVAGLAMIGMALLGAGAPQVVLLAIAFSIGNVVYTLCPPLIAEITPIGQRSAMLGITNGVYTLGGLLAPFLMGMLVDVSSSPAAGYEHGFIIAGVIIVSGGCLALLLISPERDRLRLRASVDALRTAVAPA